MAQTIQLKRSAQSGKVPDTGSLNLGELAINTYDGKLYFKKSGSVESIESVLTTNSTVTGSIRLEGTASFGSLKVNDTLTVNHGETIISGSALVTSDLTILGAVNARQFNISVISSSVLFQSGSTRFGNTSDDTHQFTGSVNVTGSLYVNGVAVATGSGAQGTYVFPNAFDFNVDDPTFGDFNSASLGYNLNFGDVETVGSPIHFVGGLSNLGDTTVIYPTSRSIDFVVDDRYVASMTSQSFYTNTTFTASLQQGYTWVGNSSGVSYAVATSSFGGALPSGVVSGSTQVIGILSSLNTYTGSNDTTNTAQNTRLTTIESVTGSYETKGRGIVSGSSQLTSSVLATTGSNTFRGTQTLSGSIIPAIDNTYDLGSATYQWRDIYVSSGSLYIDGTKVLGSTGNELQITTDVGQSIKILEAGSDSIILQSADGNIELKSSGGGNLLFDPTTGLIDVRGTLQIQDGNKITSSGGNGIVFGNNIVVSGSIESTGTINGINLSTFSSSVASTFLNQNTATSSYETKGRGIVSGSSQLTSSVLATTGSNSFIGNQNISGTLYLTGSLIPSGNFVYDLGSETNSFKDLFLSTGSIRFHNPDGTEQGRITVDAKSGDISLLKTAGLTNEQKATISQGNINPDFLTSVSASNLFVQTKIVMPAGGTVNGINLTAFSSSVASTILNQNNATSSYETKGRGIVSGSLQLTSSYDTRYVLSGSITQTTWDNIASKPGGIISGSSQLNNASIENLTVINLTTVNETASVIFSSGSNRFGDFGNDTHSFTGSVQVSGSFTLVGSSTATSYNGAINATNGIVSGSSQITYASISSIPAGIVSGSAQTILNLPTGVVSGSSQITYASISSIPGGIVSGSSQTINYLNSAAPGVVSGSSQTILNLPTGTISGSSQVNVMSTTNIARLATTGSNTFTGNITIGNATAATNVKLFLNGVASKAAGIEFQQGGTSQWYIGNGIASEDNNFELYNSNGNMAMKITKSTNAIKFIGETTIAGNVLPEANGTRDLGSSALRWSTVYTSDLSLNNGIGDWTIVEGEDDLFLYNNKKGKVYKFALTEVDPNVATPKKS